uniref:Uncharacterized protein n=1 Tax=Oryza brachyantha TaxID=4533 RepID=J3M8H1_ORYBR
MDSGTGGRRKAGGGIGVRVGHGKSPTRRDIRSRRGPRNFSGSREFRAGARSPRLYLVGAVDLPTVKPLVDHMVRTFSGGDSLREPCLVGPGHTDRFRGRWNRFSRKGLRLGGPSGGVNVYLGLVSSHDDGLLFVRFGYVTYVVLLMEKSTTYP